MKKLSFTLSLLFIIGQVLLPSIPVSATTVDNNSNTVISQEIKNAEKANDNEELEKKDNEKQENKQSNSNVDSEKNLGESGLDNPNELEEILNEKYNDTTEESILIESDNFSNDNINIKEEATYEKLDDKEEKDISVEFGEVYETVKKPRSNTSAMPARLATSQLDTNYYYSKEEYALDADNYYSKEEYAEDMNALENIEYLVKKTDSNFEVVLSMGDGVYQYADSAETIEEAIEKANSSTLKAKSVSSAIPSVVDSNGVMVYSTNAMGRILKHIGGYPYYGSDKVTYVYRDSSKSRAYTYINQGYVDDVPVIEDVGTAAKVQVAGYTGWINKDTSAQEYDMIIVPLNNVKNPSYYENINGELYHWISIDITTAGKGNKRRIGVAPSFMKTGVKYYSYDGNYFYTDLNTLISDLKAGNKNNAVNSNEAYYSYFQYLPFRSKTVYTASELDSFIASQTASNSKLRGSGQAFINAQNKYGINAVTMLGIAINESAWGLSTLALQKNNIFGLEAYDSNPNDAKAFSSVAQCIDEFAYYWISKGYGDPQDDRFYGGYLGNKSLGANVKYASDPFWGEKAASYAYSNDIYLSGGNVSSLNDYNSNILGMFIKPTKVLDSSGQTLYAVSSSLDYNSTYVGTPVVLNSLTKYNIGGRESYSINPDRTTALPSTGGSEFIGTYDWNIKGYIGTDSVKILNSVPITGISYSAHVAKDGWGSLASNGETAGTTGRNLGLEALIINLENMPSTSTIKYRAHVQDIGWQNWVSSGQIAGTVGKAKNIEAIQIEASGLPEGKTIIYRTHVQDIGWQPWQVNGGIAGTTGQNKKVEAIEIKIIDSTNISVGYSSYVSQHGWQNYVNNGLTSGTTGENRPMYGMKINVNTEIPGVGVKYKTHVQDIGWLDWSSNDEVNGSINPMKKIEAIKIELTGAPNGYHIQYRVHVQDIGWQDWVRDGQLAGTTGKNKKIEAIEIKVVKDNGIDVLYNTHVQDMDWLQEVSNGALSGTTGKNKQVEAIKIRVNSGLSGVGVTYRTHVQDIGWQGWVKNGELAGTTGKNKQVEAIEIKLTGAPSGYHIEYRAHVQDIGWQDWVRDGQLAGTTGKNKQIEAIEIRIVKE